MDYPVNFFEYILKHKKLFFSALILITAVLGWHASDLGINASPYVVDISHPVRQAHEDLKKTFHSTGEQAMLVLTFPDTVFTVERIAQLDRLSKSIQSMSLLSADDKAYLHQLILKNPMLHDETIKDNKTDNLNTVTVFKSLIDNELLKEKDKKYLEQMILRAQPVAQVRSITTVENIADDGMLSAGKLIEKLPTTEQDINHIKTSALNNVMFNNLLLDPEGKSTAIVVEFNITGDDSQNMIRAYQALLSIVSKSALSPYAHYGGVPVINAEIAQVMKKDNQKFFPIVIAVILLVIYFTFKRASVVLAALCIAVLSTVWTLGTMALFNVDMNIVSAILPIFIITIAVSDTIHFMTAYLHQRDSLNSQAVISTLQKMWLPMCLTTVTTSIGFISMAYTDLIFLSQFCLFVALGVVYALVITLMLLPQCAPWIQRYQSGELTNAHKTPVISYFNWMTSHKKTTAVGWAGVVTMVIWGALHVQVNNHSSQAFNQETKIRQDSQHITSKMGGIYPVNFWFKTDEPRALIAPKFIQALELLESQLSSYPEVGKVLSPNDFIKRIHEVLVSGTYVLPEALSRDVVAQYLFLYENSSGREIRDVLDIHYQNARMIVLFKTDKADAFKKIIHKISVTANSLLPDNVELIVTGYGAEIVTATESVVYSQIFSAVSASVLILFLLGCYYKSVWVALFGLVPLLLTVVSNFALMAAFGVYLDIGTALIIGITFGIGIDYAIHFISDLKNRLSTGESWNSAIEKTLNYVSRPIIKNSTALALGFLVLTLSSFAPLRQLGYFVCVSMILCALFTLLLLPLLFLAVKPNFTISHDSHARQYPVNTLTTMNI